MNWFELCHEFIRKYHQQKIDEANIPRVYTKKQMAEDLVEVLRERDEARAACAAMREALHSALKIPRPWMDGGLTYTEWDEAFDKVEKAIDSSNPGAPLLARIKDLEKKNNQMVEFKEWILRKIKGLDGYTVPLDARDDIHEIYGWMHVLVANYEQFRNWVPLRDKEVREHLARIAEIEKIARLAGDFIYPENMKGPWKEMNEALAAYQSVKGGI